MGWAGHAYYWEQPFEGITQTPTLYTNFIPVEHFTFLPLFLLLSLSPSSSSQTYTTFHSNDNKFTHSFPAHCRGDNSHKRRARNIENGPVPRRFCGGGRLRDFTTRETSLLSVGTPAIEVCLCVNLYSFFLLLLLLFLILSIVIHNDAFVLSSSSASFSYSFYCHSQ